MKLVEHLGDDPVMAAEMQKLEARIWRRSQRESLRVLLFTSAHRGEGKTTTVAYLAAALALHTGRKILVVDMDFREPRLHVHLGVEPGSGVGALLRGERTAEQTILRTGLPGLDAVLPLVGQDDPSLLFDPEALEKVFAQFRGAYDLVLVDVPAMIPVGDTAALLPVVDAVVLVAMAGRTTKGGLRRVREICLGMDSRILGIIVGNLQEAMPDFGYGYGYGYEYGDHGGNGKGKSGGNGKQPAQT